MSNEIENSHIATIRGFGAEWSTFDHADVDPSETRRLFEAYFRLFPWSSLNADAVGADFGCGSGRWAKFVLPNVTKLHLVDASAEALNVARKNLQGFAQAEFHHQSIENLPLPAQSLDFAYSLGVLHHLPDTPRALRDIAQFLRPGAPFLLYLYYALDDRPLYFRFLWHVSNVLRRVICRLPHPVRLVICQMIAASIYWPLARTARYLDRRGSMPRHFPLSFYRDLPFYFMRNDALDRFGTALEKRFTRAEISAMLREAGFANIQFSPDAPYWCCISHRT